jgi:hypothetical protein
MTLTTFLFLSSTHLLVLQQLSYLISLALVKVVGMRIAVYLGVPVGRGIARGFTHPPSCPACWLAL